MADDSDTSIQADQAEQSNDAQAELRAANTKGDSITVRDVSGTGIAIGHGAQANVIFTEEQAYKVFGLTNPYLGLRAFTAAERDIFAGRERIVHALVDRLSADDGDRLLLIVGASGSGKSSLARAGLFPDLADRLRNAGYTVQTRIIDHPGRMPTTSLASILQDVPDHQSSQCLLLLIDQFEEFFSQADPVACDQALSILADVAANSKLSVRIIATMRSDFLPQLMEDSRFETIEQRKVIIRAMSEDELRDAIQRPIQMRNSEKRIESALLEQLAKDAAADAAYLPLLQVTLEDLWRGGELRLGRYIGLAHAIQRRADAVYSFRDYDRLQQEQRTPEEQEAILSLFLSLVQVSLDDKQHDVRLSRPLSMLLIGSAEQRAWRRRLIDDLSTARLLSTSLESQEGILASEDSVQIDIIHESLLQHWTVLGQALLDARTLLRSRMRFEDALRTWEGKGRSNSFLLNPGQLAEAQMLAAADDIALQTLAAEVFVRRSGAQQAVQRRQKLMLGVFIGISFLTGMFFVAQRGRNEWYRQTVRTPMISIAGGTAVIDSDGQTPKDRQAPERTVALLPFWIEKYEVTNEQYQACVAFGPCTSPGETKMYTDTQHARHPVVMVTAKQAFTYCTWIDRRLPSQVEWERTARGPTGRLWPWGSDAATPDRVVLLLDDFPDYQPTDTVAVDALSAGMTINPEPSIYHLVGNVQEWIVLVPTGCEGKGCSGWWDGESDSVGVMGGAYETYLTGVTQVENFSASRGTSLFGFRCASDAP